MKTISIKRGESVRVFKGLAFYAITRAASAQEYLTNETMTEGYAKYWAGDYWSAWQWPFIHAMGPWFQFGLIASPIASWWLFQRSMHISAIWLLCVLVAYSSKIVSLPAWAFYFFIGMWVTNGMIKLFWVKYHN